jgi:hypothetical protein
MSRRPSCAAKACAGSCFKEIVPNILPPLITEFGLRFCFVFLTIAALSFLGVGIQPPTADWGSMVAESKTLITFGRLPNRSLLSGSGHRPSHRGGQFRGRLVPAQDEGLRDEQVT